MWYQDKPKLAEPRLSFSKTKFFFLALFFLTHSNQSEIESKHSCRFVLRGRSVNPTRQCHSLGQNGFSIKIKETFTFGRYKVKYRFRAKNFAANFLFKIMQKSLLRVKFTYNWELPEDFALWMNFVCINFCPHGVQEHFGGTNPKLGLFETFLSITWKEKLGPILIHEKGFSNTNYHI